MAEHRESNAKKPSDESEGSFFDKSTAAGTFNFSYSSRGELQSVTLPSGSDITYVNDPMGRRIAKAVNNNVTEKYLWQGQTRLLAVYDGTNNLISRFNYADGRMPVSMVREGTTYYLVYDQIGSVRAVIDSSGTIIKKVDYDSFGSIISDSNAAFTIPFGFAGGLYDHDTGLVRFGYRDYDPTIGKWTAKDPIDFRGGVNLYKYVSNPIQFIDPRGLEGLDPNFGGGDAPYGYDPGAPPSEAALGNFATMTQIAGTGAMLTPGGQPVGGLFFTASGLASGLKVCGSAHPKIDAVAEAMKYAIKVNEPGNLLKDSAIDLVAENVKHAPNIPRNIPSNLPDFDVTGGQSD